MSGGVWRVPEPPRRRPTPAEIAAEQAAAPAEVGPRARVYLQSGRWIDVADTAEAVAELVARPPSLWVRLPTSTGPALIRLSAIDAVTPA